MRMRRHRKVVLAKQKYEKAFVWYVDKVKLAMLKGAQRMSLALYDVYTKPRREQ